MRIVHLSAEVSPFAKTGGLGDVVGALPWAQQQLGHEVSVWMPLYRQVREGARLGSWSLSPALPPFKLDLGSESHEIALFRSELPGTTVPVYLVANAHFFDRPDLYFADPSGRDDGLQRFSVFVRGALEAMRRLGTVPDVVHAHDWHAALAPMALAWDPSLAPDFGAAASVFTIHNLAFQGAGEVSAFRFLGLPEAVRGQVLWHDRLNLMKGATLAASAVNTVSPSAAREMATPEGGFGLDPIFRARGERLVGILNGVDGRIWSPERDRHIARRYGRSGDAAARAENRRSLLTMAGMDADEPGFIVGLTGRLTHQKGFDLFLGALDELLEDQVRFVLLGTGEPPLEAAMRERSKRSRRRFFAYVGFDDTLAHLIIAGADAFLMPSRFEPCGLSQLYALSYGTLPIVRRAGGLKDTVLPFHDGNADQATGFAFDEPSARALRDTVRFAQRTRQDEALWGRLCANGMAQDFSWERSARSYLDLYAGRLEEKRARAGGGGPPRPRP
ncbi:MAG TPA: glycogen synthase [Myxococcales bacterium]